MEATYLHKYLVRNGACSLIQPRHVGKAIEGPSREIVGMGEEGFLIAIMVRHAEHRITCHQGRTGSINFKITGKWIHIKEKKRIIIGSIWN